MPHDILYQIYGEIRETRAELKAHRENSEKRMDRLEDHFRSEIKDLREDMVTPPSSTGLYGTVETTFKVLGAIYTYWPRIVWVLSAVAAAWGLKNPEFFKVLAQTKP